MGKFSMHDDIKMKETSLGGGSFLWDSGVYKTIVDMAYFDQSKGGAHSLNVTLLNEDGKTTINISLTAEDKILKFKLKNLRDLDRKSLNLLRKREISSTIS